MKRPGVPCRACLLSAQILSLACAWLLLPSKLEAQTPAPLANVRAIALPAEILLTWDAWPDAASYGVYRGNLDRRWVPIAKNVLAPRYRDTDFLTLPCYYQVAAYNAAGEVVAFSELLTSSLLPLIGGPSVNPRPISDTGFAVEANMGATPADGFLEVGTSPTNYQWSAANTNFALRQEFFVTNLQPATTYFYRLTSTRADATGSSYRSSFTTRPFVETTALVSIPTPDGLPVMITTDEDVPVRMIFAANSPSGGEVTYAVSVGPINGGSLNGVLPEVVFVPRPEAHYSDLFRVVATDGVTTNGTTVEVVARDVHDAPLALDLAATLNEDTGLKLQMTATSQEVDWTALSFIIIDQPTNGVLGRALYDPPYFVQYLPNTNFNGVDHFTFAATDGQTTGNVALARVRVQPVSDPPTASPQTVTVFRGAPTNITLAVGDVDNDPVALHIQTAPTHGTVTGNGMYLVPPLVVTYTPTGVPTNNTDSFTYSVFGNNPIYAIATVTINFVPAYYPPIAYGATFNTAWNQPVAVPLSATSPVGGALNYVVLGQAAQGTLSGTPPALTYTPSPGFYGQDGFMFKVSDGLSFSALATNIIYVWGPVPPPAPSGLSATAVSNHQINLFWSDNSWNESGFQIENSEDTRHWKLIAMAGKNTVSYSNIKLGGNTIYYYRVRATNSFGASGYSSVASARTLK